MNLFWYSVNHEVLIPVKENENSFDFDWFDYYIEGNELTPYTDLSSFLDAYYSDLENYDLLLSDILESMAYCLELQV